MNQNLKLTFSKTLFKQAALVGLVVLSSSTVFAIPSDRNQPISLLADRATYNEKTGITTYTGNVIIESRNFLGTCGVFCGLEVFERFLHGCIRFFFGSVRPELTYR